MRSIWKGSVSFGLVNVPVKLYAATEDPELPHHSVHQHDGGKIRYRKVCEQCGETVESHDIATKYVTEDGEAVLAADDLAALPSENSREINVLEFVTDQIDQRLYDRPYYLGVENNAAAKAYALLTTVLENRTAIAQFSMRSKSRLAALSVKDGVIVAHTLKWPDELRPAKVSDAETMIVQKKREELTEAEIALANQLVESMTRPFEPSKYRDTAKDELRELIAAKVDEGQGVAEVGDLLAKLEQSQAKKAPRRRKAAS